MTPAQFSARQASGRRGKARWIRLARTRTRRPSDTLPREIPLHLAGQSADQLPSLCRRIDPETGAVIGLVDPFTRRPV